MGASTDGRDGPDRVAEPARRWRLRLVAGLVAVAVLGGAVFELGRASKRPRKPQTAAATTTASVARSDLAETTPVNGTVGYARPVSLVEPAGTASTALTQGQQALASAQENMTADQTALADANASSAQGVDQAQQAVSTAQAALAVDTGALADDQASLSAAQQKVGVDCQGDQAGAAPPSGSGSSSPCAADAAAVTADQQKVTGDQQKVTADQTAMQSSHASLTSAQQKVAEGADQGQAKLAADRVAFAAAASSAAVAQAAATAYAATSRYTALPSVGQVIAPGQSLWSVDGAPVTLLQGAVTAWRAFAMGMSAGADVAALNQALISIGLAGTLRPSDAFTSDTVTAVKRLQASLGQPQSGTLSLGSVIFEPAAVRVTVVHPVIGSPVQGGASVVDVTSTTPIVNVALPVDQTFLVKIGDAVTVTMPDGSTAKGAITAVGSVATNSTPSSGPGSNAPSATVNLTVSLSNPSPAGSLDQAPVTVNITNASAPAALAVPVSALLALAGGGYAVEVVASDGTHRLVGVTTGLFDDQAGLVQVTGTDLDVGQQIVVAA